MSLRNLIIDGVIVPTYASTEIGQTYAKLRATYPSRMRDGSLKQRHIWGTKLSTTITGSGVIPVGIGEDGLVDYDNPIVISCVGHRAINSASNVITLPAARRSDAGSEPYGRAFVGDKWQTTPVALVTNTATLTAVSGATQYQCVYFPEITCFAEPPVEQHPQHGPVFSWTLTAEEI